MAPAPTYYPDSRRSTSPMSPILFCSYDRIGMSSSRCKRAKGGQRPVQGLCAPYTHQRVISRYASPSYEKGESVAATKGSSNKASCTRICARGDAPLEFACSTAEAIESLTRHHILSRSIPVVRGRITWYMYIKILPTMRPVSLPRFSPCSAPPPVS